MKHHRVESSTLHSIGYEPVEGVLSARFLCGCAKDTGEPKSDCGKCAGVGHKGNYSYPSADDRAKGKSVPPDVYASIRDAKAQGLSTGKVFTEKVKRAGYTFDFTPHSR